MFEAPEDPFEAFEALDTLLTTVTFVVLRTYELLEAAITCKNLLMLLEDAAVELSIVVIVVFCT